MEKKSRPMGITIVAILMIIFGLSEVVAGFTHIFFGISITPASTYLAATIGSFYVIAGLLIFSMMRWAAVLAMVLLIADILGRIYLVVIGYYPITPPIQAIAIFIGTLIVAVFTFYIWTKWELYQ